MNLTSVSTVSQLPRAQKTIRHKFTAATAPGAHWTIRNSSAVQPCVMMSKDPPLPTPLISNLLFWASWALQSSDEMQGRISTLTSAISGWWVWHSQEDHWMQIHYSYGATVRFATYASSLPLTCGTLAIDVQGHPPPPGHPEFFFFGHAWLNRAHIKHIAQFEPLYHQSRSIGLSTAQDAIGCKFTW